MFIPMTLLNVAQVVASAMQTQVPLWACCLAYLLVSAALSYASRMVVLTFRLGLCTALGYCAWRFAPVRYGLLLAARATAGVVSFVLRELQAATTTAVLIHVGLFICSVIFVRLKLARGARGSRAG
jgi:hypothetical protein